MSSFLVKRASWHCSTDTSGCNSDKYQVHNPAWDQLFHDVPVTFVYLVNCIVFIKVVYLFSEYVVCS